MPSAVSVAIANLEAELGLLLDRSGREPRPTVHAQALLPQARVLVEGVQALNIHALSLHQGLESVLKLAMVQDGRADLALVFERYGTDASERFQEVAQETLVAVLASHHPLPQRMPASGIRDEHLLAERQILVAGRHADQVDKRIAISRLQWTTDNPMAALRLMETGLGWAWLPSGFVREPLALGQLVQIPSENFSNSLQLWVGVVWSASRPLGLAALRFVDLLAQERVAKADRAKS